MVRNVITKGFRTWTAALLVLVLSAAGFAQSDGGDVPADRPTFTFKEDVTLTTLDVVVIDEDGNFINDLREEDFIVFENAVEQEIVTFDIQMLGRTTKGAGAAEQVSVEIGGETQTAAVPQQDAIPRSIVLLFDTYNTPVGDLGAFKNAQRAARNFVETQALPTDLISVMNLSRTVKAVQDFTNNHQRVLDAIDSITLGRGPEGSDYDSFLPADLLGGESAQSQFEDSNLDQGTRAISPDALEQRHSAKSILKTLALLGRTLKPIKGRKTIIYFSKGFSVQDRYLHYYVEEAVDRLNDGNTTLYAMDITNAASMISQASEANMSIGPYSLSGPGGGAVSAGGEAGTGPAWNLEGTYANQSSLSALSIDTGGRFFQYADQSLTEKMEFVSNEISNYYLIGYYSNASKKPGKFNRVRVECIRPGSKIVTRKGYFTPEKFADLNDQERRMMLLEALYFNSYKDELPVQVNVDYFKDSNNSLIAPVTLSVPGSEVFGIDSSSEAASLEIIASAYDVNGEIIDLVHKNVNLTLKTAFSHFKEKNLKFLDVLQLNSPVVRVKVIIRDNQTGSMVVKEIDTTSPSFKADGLFASGLMFINREDDAIVISRQNLEDEGIIEVDEEKKEKGKRPSVRSPLVLNGRILTPKPTPLFTSADEAYLFFQLDNFGVDLESALPQVFLSYRVIDPTSGKSVSPNFVNVSSHYEEGEGMKILSRLSLSKLKPGNYRLVARATDMISGAEDVTETTFEVF